MNPHPQLEKNANCPLAGAVLPSWARWLGLRRSSVLLGNRHGYLERAGSASGVAGQASIRQKGWAGPVR